MTNHQLAPCEYGVRCTVCHREWRTPPVSTCPGVRVYAWESAPPHLKTKTQLDEMGRRLAPGQEPVGALPNKRRGYYWLYDMNHALAKPKATPAQLAALEKARAVLREQNTCMSCGLFSRREVIDRLCLWCDFQQMRGRDRKAASEWARLALSTPDEWVLLDTEATGLRNEDEIVQVAVLAPSGVVLLDTLVKPSIPIPPETTAIHGITDAMVSNAPSFAEVYPALVAAVQGKTVVAYNVEFDRRIVHAMCRRHFLPIPHVRWSCAMVWYSQFEGDWSNHWGTYRYQRLSGATHSAVEDCRATLQVIQEMAQQPRIISGMKEDEWRAWLETQRKKAP